MGEHRPVSDAYRDWFTSAAVPWKLFFNLNTVHDDVSDARMLLLTERWLRRVSRKTFKKPERGRRMVRAFFAVERHRPGGRPHAHGLAADVTMTPREALRLWDHGGMSVVRVYNPAKRGLGYSVKLADHALVWVANELKAGVPPK